MHSHHQIPLSYHTTLPICCKEQQLISKRACAAPGRQKDVSGLPEVTSSSYKVRRVLAAFDVHQHITARYRGKTSDYLIFNLSFQNTTCLDIQIETAVVTEGKMVDLFFGENL